MEKREIRAKTRAATSQCRRKDESRGTIQARNFASGGTVDSSASASSSLLSASGDAASAFVAATTEGGESSETVLSMAVTAVAPAGSTEISCCSWQRLSVSSVVISRGVGGCRKAAIGRRRCC